ncbi:hypothetical protein [Nocardioides ferulae]|uniref:hypothetical protein n=1 Tax=Nocardioides ferulae TaxID=2340821 RepID=UPI0013DDB563|nr:hypothetical protein [Nocardioides ferulae]
MSSTRRPRGKVFAYQGFSITADGVLTCEYTLDDERFTERFEFTDDGADFLSPAVQAAARVLFLLAGISYYKTGAPPLILGPADGLTPLERDFLLAYHLNGLAEFSYRDSGADITGLRIEAAERPVPDTPTHVPTSGPLVPFGGGIDSVVVVEEIRKTRPDAALFIANTSDVDFEPIEKTAAITELPVRRVRRHLDPKVLESRARGYLNGHVPVTAIISAAAVVTAAAHGHDRVVMSNEHSASEPTRLRANGVSVNHQWSKGEEFESRFRDLLAEGVRGIDYYSELRPFSELWVARRFADLPDYHHAFRSCNRAFYVDDASRLSTWCGTCDKCAFIDLILSPYLERERLEAIFKGNEPLANPELEPVFQSLLGHPGLDKPLECVGDEAECRTALRLAAGRPDRVGNELLARLTAYVDDLGKDVPTETELLAPIGHHFVPDLQP